MEVKAMPQAITQSATNAAEALVKVVTEVTGAVADNVGRGTVGSAGPKTDMPLLKQPIFSWTAKVKYTELSNFEMKVNNNFMTKL